MKLVFGKLNSNYEPMAVSWFFEEKNISLDFSVEISAIYSEKLEQVVVELYDLGKLYFYSVDGTLNCEVGIPKLPKYQYRGLNKNNKSKSGICILFHPIDESVGNEWRDTEQYEMVMGIPIVVGDKLDIYR